MRTLATKKCEADIVNQQKRLDVADLTKDFSSDLSEKHKRKATVDDAGDEDAPDSDMDEIDKTEEDPTLEAVLQIPDHVTASSRTLPATHSRVLARLKALCPARVENT